RVRSIVGPADRAVTDRRRQDERSACRIEATPVGPADGSRRQSGGPVTAVRLAGQRALVTGGSRSIRRAIAVGLARGAADGVVNYLRNRAAAEQTAADIRALGRRAAVVQGDTSVREDVERLVREAIEALGAIDLLVNNAGVLKRTPLLEIA